VRPVGRRSESCETRRAKERGSENRVKERKVKVRLINKVNR